MALNLYADSGKTRPLRVELGRLVGDGATTTFPVTAFPEEVRLYSSTYPYGLKKSQAWTGDGVTTTFTVTDFNIAGLTAVYVDGALKSGGGVDYTVSGNDIVFTTAPASNAKIVATTGWTCDGSTVTLSAAAATGETWVAFSAGERIFETYTFLSNSADVNDRTRTQQIWVEASGYNYDSIQVSMFDYFFGGAADLTWHSLSTDGATYQPVAETFTGDGTTTTFTLTAFAGTKLFAVYVDGVLQTSGTDYTVSGNGITFAAAPANGASIVAISYIDLGNLTDGYMTSFYIKAVVPQDTPVQNYRDLAVVTKAIEKATTP